VPSQLLAVIDDLLSSWLSRVGLQVIEIGKYARLRLIVQEGLGHGLRRWRQDGRQCDGADRTEECGHKEPSVHGLAFHRSLHPEGISDNNVAPMAKFPGVNIRIVPAASHAGAASFVDWNKPQGFMG
jgi:hypothetical protein